MPPLQDLFPAGRRVLATSLFGDPAAGFCEDASARVYEHPTLLRLLDLSLGLVLSTICPPAAMSKCPEAGNPIAKCDCVRSYAAPDPPIRRQVSIGRHAVRVPRPNGRSVAPVCQHSPLDLCTAATMGAHDGVGQAARKLWPEEVITDRYHFCGHAGACSGRDEPPDGGGGASRLVAASGTDVGSWVGRSPQQDRDPVTRARSSNPGYLPGRLQRQSL